MAGRRRSSAATRPAAAPPPSLPIPSLPIPASPEITRQPPHPDTLEDPPPPSILRPPPDDPPDPAHRDLRVPHEPRIPSSRRALTRALELAREAVQLDSTNEEPQAAVIAYGRSVALLSEVMERVRRGEDSTETRRRNGRPRSAVAQEEEVRRLQNIHDTYADRMNILSIIYDIPAVPYSTSNEYSAMAAMAPESAASPTDSQSPTSDTGHMPPPAIYTYDDHPDSGHDRDPDASMFPFDHERSAPGPISHPYAAAASYDDAPAPSASRAPRRVRNGSTAALPPAPPPPSNSLPPAPGALPEPEPPRMLEVGRAPHRRSNSGSRLVVLEEEPREYIAPQPRQPQFIPERPESPPLPPIPSPPSSRSSTAPPKAPPSPRLSNIITPRPRGSSYATPPPPQVPMGVINGSPNLGTISQRRTTKSSAPPSSRSSSPAESTTSVNSMPKSAASSLPGSSNSSGVAIQGRSRSVSQPGRRPSLVNGRISPTPDQRPPLPLSSNGSVSAPRKSSFASNLNPNQLMVRTDLMMSSVSLGPPIFGQLPTTPTSPLPPAPPSDPLRKPYHMMNLLRGTMTSPTGGYVTRRLHVPQEVWSQGGAKLTNISEKVRVVAILCSALEDLQTGSSEHFGAGNVSSGLALGIGSIGRKEGEAWLARLEDFSTVCDGVVANFGKKLGVGEGFVLKKTTWGGKLIGRFGELTNGKNLDSPAAYVSGLRRLFLHAQLLDEHSKAISSQPVAPAYAALPADIRGQADKKLKRASQFFATVVLTFVIRDLSQLLDKYAKKCEKWLAE
ncbi:hypothetical protein C8F04DRAFT_1076174 [Mycena alexandri]|uniref:MIT domain-containing protein n=1 Tax=Mycena alexandri TaxID=1745969 RepID=A0AAD6TAL0_9AGAR|nr:hypothetical protein C8F04DRAFT_1076174 [Mycena alexandri]